MGAEVVIFFDAELAPATSSSGASAAAICFSKMRLLSSQLDAYFADGLWLDNARHANAMARRLVAGLTPLKGTPLLYPVDANEIFVVLPARDARRAAGRPARSTTPGRPTGRASGRSGWSPPSTPIPPTSTVSCPSPKQREFAMTHQRTLTAAHWGVYEVEYDDKGQAAKLHPFSKDPDPSPIGLHMLSDEVARLRVRRPAFRKSWLEKGPGANSDKRGQEPFVELPWDEALDRRRRRAQAREGAHGNRAIFGGSYGWSSAGRFHHAQSQVHRFLNAIGGYVRHMDSYSLGAARVLMPHIVAGMEDLMSMHTPWEVLAEHCKLFVTFGGAPHKNAQINAGGAMVHQLKDGLYGMRAKGVRFVNITPTAEDLDTGGEIEWLAIRPNTDAAMILALCHVLLTEKLYDREFLDRCTVGFDKFAP